MLNLITIVFNEELPVLKMQAQSISLYLDPHLVSNIVVVVNDHQSVISRIDKSWWGPFSNRVIVIPRNMFSHNFTSTGWHSQQLLKLLAASICYNPWSLILDAKTLFVRALTNQDLFDQNQQPMVGHCLSIPTVFSVAHDQVKTLFEITLDTQISPGGVPFFLHNATVRSMISKIEKLTGETFDQWFQSRPDLTEFLLYSGFVLNEYGNYSYLYNINRCCMRAVNLGHNELDLTEKKFLAMYQPETSTVSIHRHAWTNLSAEHQQQYKHYLATKGITCEL
jgi:hypothetical protein